MVHHNSRRGLLGLQQKPRGQAYADILFRMQQREQLGLVFQIRTRRMPNEYRDPRYFWWNKSRM